MTPPSSLAAQLPALRQAIDRAENTLDELAEIDSGLHHRVARRFSALIERCQNDLADLESDLRNGTDAAVGYERLRETRRRCSELFQESLAFTQGALIRSTGLDAGICHIADQLLDELSERCGIAWGRLTVLAETDFYGEAAQIIRIRFPEVSLWHLPVAAHEFGHFAGPKICIQRTEDGFADFEHPFQAILKREFESNPIGGWHHTHEYFADMFATYALGPAFVYASIVLRFDPGTASVSDGRHPPAARRFDLMRRTLSALAAAHEECTAYQGVIDHLDARWKESREAAGKTDELSPDEERKLTSLFADLLDLLELHLGPARYSTFRRAQELAPQLKRDRPIDLDDPSVCDILNAAWVARIRAGEGDERKIDALARRASEACGVA